MPTHKHTHAYIYTTHLTVARIIGRGNASIRGLWASDESILGRVADTRRGAGSGWGS